MNRPLLHYYLALNHMKAMTPNKLKQYLTAFPSIEALFSSSQSELESVGIRQEDALQLLSPNWQAVEEALKWQAAAMNHIICQADDAYPMRLKEIPDPPLVLYVQGDSAILADNQLAMVGSRHPSMVGVKQAEQFALGLAQAGLTITSGLALGIDAASHRGTLMAQGKTIAVAGTGLYHRYPKTNQALIEKILQQGGAYVAEFPLNTQALPQHFPQRNRIIAGLSLGVLVVEAAIKSGSLITAHYALEQGREVFALPGSIQQPQKRGCHALIRQGAKLVETVQDILEEFPGLVKNQQISLSQAISQEEARVLKQIDYEKTSMDVILLRSGLTAGEVSSILLLLELSGHIRPVLGGYARTI